METKNSAYWQWRDAIKTAYTIDPHDRHGEPIFLGSVVRYGFDRKTPWTTDRWGVVTGIARNPGYTGSQDVSVRVSHVDVSDGVPSTWDSGDWFAAPESVVVMS